MALICSGSHFHCDMTSFLLYKCFKFQNAWWLNPWVPRSWVIFAQIYKTLSFLYTHILFTVIYFLFICIEKYNTVPGFVILTVLTDELIGHLILGSEPYNSTRCVPAFSGSTDRHWSAEGMLGLNPERGGKYQKHWGLAACWIQRTIHNGMKLFVSSTCCLKSLKLDS